MWQMENEMTEVAVLTEEEAEAAVPFLVAVVVLAEEMAEDMQIILVGNPFTRVSVMFSIT